MNHTQRIKIGSAFIDCTNIAKPILQGSTLSLILLLNIFINDLFFFSAKYEISYFADDKNIDSCGMNLGNIFTILIHIL